VIQEERSIFWDMIVLVIVRQKVHMNMSISEFPYLDFCLWGSMRSKVYKRKVNTQDKLLARILDTAAHIKKREDQL
jgi:hypothetical protein